MVVPEIAELIADTDTDFYLYTGDISIDGADKLYSKIIRNKKKRRKGSLILTTYGGDPNAAYRIARLLKRTYGGFSLYVFGFCKSAGTLLALGADEIIMSEFGELGPLDIQIPKVDELNHESGLVYSQALLALRAHAFDFFEECYLSLKQRSGGTISTKTASTIASSLAVGMIVPLAEQIDPLKVGEATRALDISFAYGKRLTQNINALTRLINEYTTHGFVIDWEEARDLLGNVRQLDDKERVAFESLVASLRTPKQNLSVAFIDEILEDTSANNLKGDNHGTDQQPGETCDKNTITEDAGNSPKEQFEANNDTETIIDSKAGENNLGKSGDLEKVTKKVNQKSK